MAKCLPGDQSSSSGARATISRRTARQLSHMRAMEVIQTFLGFDSQPHHDRQRAPPAKARLALRSTRNFGDGRVTRPAADAHHHLECNASPESRSVFGAPCSGFGAPEHTPRQRKNPARGGVLREFARARLEAPRDEKRRAEKGIGRGERLALCRPGNDLLSRVLRHSTISAEELNGRVRDGIGCELLAQVTEPAQGKS
jgi:hypothetical protein